MKEFMSKKAIEVFGKEYELASMERILGGAQKYTYLAKCINGFEFIIYQWDNSTTYFEKNDEKFERTPTTKTISNEVLKTLKHMVKH